MPPPHAVDNVSLTKRTFVPMCAARSGEEVVTRGRVYDVSAPQGSLPHNTAQLIERKVPGKLVSVPRAVPQQCYVTNAVLFTGLRYGNLQTYGIRFYERLKTSCVQSFVHYITGINSVLGSNRRCSDCRVSENVQVLARKLSVQIIKKEVYTTILV